jgi:hypothetical protein
MDAAIYSRILNLRPSDLDLRARHTVTDGRKALKEIFDVLTTVSASAQLLMLLLLWSPALADDREGLIGNWKLLSFYTEDAQTKDRNNVYGEHPKGFVCGGHRRWT